MIVKAKANGFEGLITEGKEYEVIREYNGFYLVKNDKSANRKYPKVIFEEVVEKILDVEEDEVVINEQPNYE